MPGSPSAGFTAGAAPRSKPSSRAASAIFLGFPETTPSSETRPATVRQRPLRIRRRKQASTSSASGWPHRALSLSKGYATTAPREGFDKLSNGGGQASTSSANGVLAASTGSANGWPHRALSLSKGHATTAPREGFDKLSQRRRPGFDKLSQRGVGGFDRLNQRAPDQSVRMAAPSHDSGMPRPSTRDRASGRSSAHRALIWAPMALPRPADSLA